MREFLAFVLVPGDTTRERIQDAVGRAMAPYDVNLETPWREDHEVPDCVLRTMVDFYRSARIRGLPIGVQVEGVDRPVNADERLQRLDELLLADPGSEDVAAIYELIGYGWNGRSWRRREDGSWVGLTRDNPAGFWDWWRVGGNWDGILQVRENTLPVVPGHRGGLSATAARLVDIDWGTMLAAREAAAQDALRQLVAGALDWAAGSEAVARLMMDFPASMSAEDWVAKARRVLPLAFVDAGGCWHGPAGVGGPFVEYPGDDEDWPGLFDEALARSPSTSILVVVHCHV